MIKGKICNFYKGKQLFFLVLLFILTFLVAPSTLAESIMLDQQVSIMSAQDIAISKILLLISGISSYLIGLFIILLIVSVALLFKQAAVEVRARDKAYALPQIIFKKPINSFEKLGPRDKQGTYTNSYAAHKKYHKVAKGSFWATLGASILKIVLIYAVSHIAISGIMSMAQEDFFDAGKTIQCGDILTYQITYENVGTGAATGATITAYIPHGTDYIEGSAILNGSSIEPIITDNVIEFYVGTVLPGESGYIVYSVAVPPCPEEPGQGDYDQGYAEGYDLGYSEGFYDYENQNGYGESYNNIYENYEEGYEGGYNYGYQEGYYNGYYGGGEPLTGPEYEEGCVFGYSLGYENGYLEAPFDQSVCGTGGTDYEQGCFYGYEIGYYDGLDGLDYNLDACYGGGQTMAMFKMAQAGGPISNQATFTYNEGDPVPSNVVENPVDTGAPAGGEVCGNNILEGSEECDDGNTADGDGCSSTCTLEPVLENVMPEGIYEPLCCIGGGTGCEADNAFTDEDADCATGNPLYGTHLHTFNIPFTDMPVGSIGMACNVTRSDGSTLNLNNTVTNTEITNLHLSHTLSSSSPIDNNIPWQIQGCTYSVDGSAPVTLPGAAGHKIYVHSTSWTGVQSANDDAKRALDCYSEGLNRFFGNTEKCSFSGDVAFAMTMASGTNLEGYCHDSRDNDGNTLIDCPDNSCHGLAYPTCSAYRVSSAMIASSICPGNICTGTVNFSNKTVTYSYTQHVKPNGKFKVKFSNGAVTSGTGLISNYISFIPQFTTYGKYPATGLSTLPNDVLFPDAITPTSYQTYADSIDGTVNHVMWVQFSNVVTSDEFELLLTYDNQIRRASGLYLYPHNTAPSNDDESEVVADLNMDSPCADNVDNDLDFGTDCADIQCDGKIGNTVSGAKCEYGTELTCDDEFDNDRDGFADCLDPDCDGKQGGKVSGNPVYCEYGNESGSTNCGDQFDNDADGQSDCLDQTSCWHNDSFGCPSTEINCSDNIDNDHDQNYSNNYDTDPATGIDCTDYDCAGDPACPSTENQEGDEKCFDSKDNDLDFTIDCYDIDCLGVKVGDNACYEQEFVLGQANRCNNSKEDDFDAPTAKKDCADNQKDRTNPAVAGSDCWAIFEMCGPCPSNEFISYGACADGIDNDYDDGAGGYGPGSGGADCSDSDCLGQIGNYQGDICQAAESNCSDDFDNDKDGAVDCADSGCSGKTGSQGQVCEPGGEISCSDGYDNDRDGLSDCADPNCFGVGTCIAESWRKVGCVAVPQTTSLTSIVVGGTIQYESKARVHSNDNYTIRFVGTASDYSTVRIVVGQGGATIPFNATSCTLSGPSAGSLVYSSSQQSSGKIDAVTTPLNTFDVTLTCPLTGVAGTSYNLPISVTANRTSGAFEVGSAFPSPTIAVYESQKPTISKIAIEGVVSGNVDVVYNDSIKLKGNPSDTSTGGSGICSCEFTVDGNTGTTGNDCVYTLNTLKSDKTYNATTAAGIDGANNKSGTASASFTVNVMPVEINYTKLSRAYYNSSNSTLNTGDIIFQTADNGTFSSGCNVNIKDSTGSSVRTTTISKSGTNPVTCSGTIDVGGLADGQYILEVTVTDEDSDSVTSQKVFYVCNNTSSPGCERADMDNDNVPETTFTNLYSSIHGAAISCDSCEGIPNTGQDHDGDGIDNACDSDWTGAVCGNGVVETGEECDDGNVLDGDGCSSICKIEGAAAVCGNGVVETGEECDDGNNISGDGCSNSCTIEITAVCGNGVIEAGEECDDGNTASGDGCSATCLLEVAPGCGNGVVEVGEGCDDGNNIDGDGCSANCRVETAAPVCGNSVLEVGEECDDGNNIDGDGCSANCTVEEVIVPGAPVCGNGILEVGEECDDGNNLDDDGCDSKCDIEREKEEKALPLTLADITAPFEPIVEGLKDLKEAISNTVVGQQINKLYQSEAVQYTQKNILSPTIYTATILNLLSFLFLPDLLQYFTYFFTEPFAFLFRRKRKKWGTVYNSMTKMPVAYTIVRVYDKNTNKLVKTTVTDKDGRYLFILDPGQYYIAINKKEYEFPSKYLKEKNTDYNYLDIYHGTTINVTEENANVTVNIPIDPDKKMRPNSTVLTMYALKKIQSFISYVGPILAIVAFIIAPTWKYFVFLAIHAVLFSFFKALALRTKPKSFGIVQEKKSGNPISRSIVRVFETKYNKLLDTQVADGSGRYAFLVGQNTYKVNTQKHGYKDTNSKPIDLTKKEKEAIIDVDLKMEKA